MTMTELREAFAAWRKAQTGQAVLAYNLVRLLTDPTPITEAGLRELGFERYFGSCVWWLGDLRFTYEDDTLRFDRREIKTIGRLRMLLLSVGES